MFFRIVLKAVIHRRNRMAVAMLALVVGSAITAAMLSVYYDASQKMSRELRAYGANVMLSPSGDNQFLDDRVPDEILARKWPAEITGAAPYLFVVANGRGAGLWSRLVVSGTWIERARAISPWWKVGGSWGDSQSSCLVGADLAKQLGIKPGEPLLLAYGQTNTLSGSDASGTSPAAAGSPETSPSAGTPTAFTVTGILTTGGAEDSQVMIPLQAAERLSGLDGKISGVALSVTGDKERIEALAAAVDSSLPAVKARVVRQIAESEGRIVSRLRLMMLLITALILAAASLSVGTTLTALVIERRAEIGTMKALGAQDNRLLRLFLAELGALGAVGGVVGYAIGIVMAQAIGRSLFGSAVTPRPLVFGGVVLISLAVAMLSGIVPIKRIRQMEPAVILKGE